MSEEALMAPSQLDNEDPGLPPTLLPLSALPTQERRGRSGWAGAPTAELPSKAAPAAAPRSLRQCRQEPQPGTQAAQLLGCQTRAAQEAAREACWQTPHC